VWRFDGGDITSDGGALLLKQLEQRTGIVRRFAACFQDYRRPDLIEHPLLDLILQRVFGLALGYEDLNDHDELRRDPMLAVALGKDDVKGERRRRAQDRGKALAGKSTLNRLELTAPDYDGSPHRKESEKPETKKIVVDPESIDALLVDLFLEAHPQAPEKIVLDLDATDDTLYGNQEGRFYHGYYRDYCYLPLYVFCGEHLLCARLRMRNARKRVQHRCVGRFGGGVGAADRAPSPALAGGEDSIAGRRGVLPGEADGVVRARGHGLCLRAGTE
jgi:hypothetical protein